jgi:hypothetical protein
MVYSILIRHLKGHIRKQYLDFLIKNGYETKQFYKYALKYSRKLFLYKNGVNIEGIIGFSNTISLEKDIRRASYPILYIKFIYCKDKQLFELMITNIIKYAVDNNIPRIFIQHSILYDDILINLEFDKGYCGDNCINESICLICYNNPYNYEPYSYYKDVLDEKSYRTIYNYEYDPNKLYDSYDDF